MAGTDYCDPERLLAFTDRVEGISESLDSLITRVEEARVADGAFGRMPYISDRVRDAYDEHVEGVEDGLSDAQTGILGAGLGVAKCAADWLQAETQNVENTINVGGGGR